MPSSLAQNLAGVRSRIEAATARAGRPPGSVRLVAVTKTVGADRAVELARLGQLDLGENRVGELERKRAALEGAGLAARWHFIGHLQRNKARRVLRVADVVHSVDSPRLLETLERLAAEEARRPEIWLQVHATGEPTKHGLAPEAVPAVVAAASRLAHLRLVGLMAMGPLEGAAPDVAGSGAAARPSAAEVFRRVAGLARELESDAALVGAFAEARVRLSMGMSSDFEAAILAGSDVVRVGTALFG